MPPLSCARVDEVDYVSKKTQDDPVHREGGKPPGETCQLQIGKVLAWQGSRSYILMENELNALGYRFLNEEEYDEAIAVFQLNVDAFPDSWNVYDSLGEAYWKNGQLDLARSLYTRSLEINPESESGQRALAEIGTVVAQE